MSILSVLIVTAGIAIIYTSFVEWALHRFVMHKPLRIPIPFTKIYFTYPFQAHEKTHHHVFRADDSYHLHDEKYLPLITMEKWNGPVLTLIATVPSIPFCLIWTWWIALVVAAIVGVYYCVYEYIHYCMHLPKDRKVERSTFYRRLNGHHLLHHRYMKKNFNVVFPLADWLTGTLMKRAPVKFKQPKGPSIPNVQPIESLQEILQTQKAK